MSTDNAARFYWGKLEKAVAIFKAGNLEKAQDMCCELGNEFRCPRFCQVEAWMLRSRCFPDNYWFAKSSLDHALKICVSCESYKKATERELQALADLKGSVEKMLEGRLGEYVKHWRAKGREPPTEDEWYKIVEDEAGDSGDEWLEVAEDEKENPLSGPVKLWPFKGTVPNSFLVGKTFPPKRKGLTKKERQKDDEQSRQYEEEQDHEMIESMDLAMKEAMQEAEEVAQGMRQMEIAEGMVDDGPQAEDAPLSPAASEKHE